MKGMIHTCVPVALHRRTIACAAGLLRDGGVIGYPTETVYGVGGDARSAEAAGRIFRLKKRESGKPVPLLVASAEEIDSLIGRCPKTAPALMKAFWPGPLTLVFEAMPELPEMITGGTGRVAVRVSSDPVVRALLALARLPLISTSANPSGETPACSAKDLLHYFPEGLDAVLDGGKRCRRPPSTVLDISQDPPVVVRAGAVSSEALRSIIGEVHGP